MAIVIYSILPERRSSGGIPAKGVYVRGETVREVLLTYAKTLKDCADWLIDADGQLREPPWVSVIREGEEEIPEWESICDSKVGDTERITILPAVA